MKRIAVVLSSVLSLIALSVTLGGIAWGATGTSSTAIIQFNDAAQQAVLIIPTPACPASLPNCQWKFFLNEPKLHVDVSTVYGTSGTLTLDYPPDFCGVIQADAYIGGPPWVPQRGFQHTIEDCNSVTPTTSPPATVPVPPTTPPTPVIPPPVSGNSNPPAVVVPPTVAPAPAPVTIPYSATQTSLPFTGINTKPMWYLGLTLLVLGIALAASKESWRRVRRRASSFVHAVLPALGRIGSPV